MSAPTPSQEPATAEEQKLSPAEIKKRAKAEKQARRAAQKEQQPEASGPPPAVPNGVNGEAKAQKPDAVAVQYQKPKNEKSHKAQQKQTKPSGQETESQHQGATSQQQVMPIRRRGSQTEVQKVAPKKENKQVELFSHLYNQPRRHQFEGVSKDVHPAVLALGFQISSYEICGSSARCVAMLLAFKEAIQAYTTPAGTSLARHLEKHHLSPQIDFLKSCRPISESMGNAIRWLKKLIVGIDPATPEQEAKDGLCEKIDVFIRERITIADQAIAASASLQIRHDSVVLVYAKSSLVEKTILEAHANGTTFRVIVIDSRPLSEGKSLANSLLNSGIRVEYLPFSALSHAVKQATLVLLGAHSMLSNGRLLSRLGTASVAMQAARSDIPVIVCCESVKFSDKVALDSIVLNEVAPAEELLMPSHAVTTAKDEGNESAEQGLKSLSDWKDIANLQILNLMYDVTPTEYIRMVICEYGSLPPSSVPVVHRLANEGV